MSSLEQMQQRGRISREITAIQNHNCGQGDWLRRYERHLPSFLEEGPAGVEALNRKLYWFFCDERNVRLALSHIRDRGGTAPGPDGFSICHLSTPGAFFSFAEGVHHQIRHHGYVAGPVKRINARKTSGKGTRPIVLMNLEDRVVHRAAMQVLRPVLHHIARHRYSMSTCVGLGRQWLLAKVEQLVLRGQHFLVVDDLRDAFENVPLRRLIDIVHHYLQSPSERIQKLVRQLLFAGKSRGLKQGAASSSMFLDLYLSHIFERPWMAQHPNWPLLRYADDLAGLTASSTEAKEAAQALQEMLIPIGMTPKAIAAGEPIIRNLAAGESADYLGFSLSMRDGEVVFDLLHDTFEKLRRRLGTLARQGRDLEMEDNFARRMIGWVQQQGPAYDEAKILPCWNAFCEMGEELELPPPLSLDDFRCNWMWAKMEWDRIQRRVAVDFVEGDEFA